MLSQKRAVEIFEQAKQQAGHGPWSDQLDKIMTRGERLEINALWNTMNGSSCFVDAFLRFVHNHVASKAYAQALKKLEES